MPRAFAAGVLTLALLGATSAQLDSQYVLQRYTLAVETLVVPKTVVFSYTVSQAGPSNIEQRHTIYRNGMNVRDETLAIDGISLHHKIVQFSRREDRYAVSRFAPRADDYELLFLGTAKDGHHLDYVYEATPLARPSGAWIDRLTIDGLRFLPRVVRFHTGGADAHGTGQIEFAQAGKYWVPVEAAVTALVGGKAARERIAWNDYRFPESLPESTFEAPKPLPRATLPQP